MIIFYSNHCFWGFVSPGQSFLGKEWKPWFLLNIHYDYPRPLPSLGQCYLWVHAWTDLNLRGPHWMMKSFREQKRRTDGWRGLLLCLLGCCLLLLMGLGTLKALKAVWPLWPRGRGVKSLVLTDGGDRVERKVLSELKSLSKKFKFEVVLLCWRIVGNTFFLT